MLKKDKALHLLRKSTNYIRVFGARTFIRKGFEKLLEKLYTKFVLDRADLSPAETGSNICYHRHFSNLRPLPTFISPSLAARVNLITDSINPGSLYGGVGTAIIFCALLSKKKGCQLRIITRTEKADADNFFEILKSNNISYKENVEFIFSDTNTGLTEIDVSTEDIFVTTSWWTTYSALQSVPSHQIVYLLQEDERMFYPYGDEHLLCSNVLTNPEIRFVINTELLFNYFIEEKFKNIERNGLWFEPSFTSYKISELSSRPNRKRKFFFYARPNHPRNLFHLGLASIEAAISRGILDVEEWELYFVGQRHKTLQLPQKIQFNFVEGLKWSEYATFLSSIDIGLCLMYTPHPSYPPLDLAASGCIAVTNQFGPKQNLQQYSHNIICKEATVESLVQGIIEGIELSQDREKRQKNYENSSILKDWQASFNHVLKVLDAN